MCYIYPPPIEPPQDFLPNLPPWPQIWPQTSGTVSGHCEHCGNWHQGKCPRIKAIEYHENGNVKRVEYHETK